jgi:large-conductance mechanosensitive channel
MRLNEAEKKEALQSALCAALGTAGTVLILEFFRIPNCYLSLSLACFLSLLPRAPLSHLAMRIAALSLGLLLSMAVLVFFPEAPWFYIPLIGTISAIGYSIFFKHSGPASAYAFSAFFLAFHVTMIANHLSQDPVIEALNLWCQATITMIIVYLACLITKDKKPTPVFAKFTSSSMISMGLTLTVAVLWDATIKSDQAARLVMASISGIAALELEKSTGNFVQRMFGYFLGAAIATAFIVAAVALGNNITVYIVAVGGLFGLLEWLSSLFQHQATIYRAIAGMISFSIFMTPAPDRNFHIAYERITNSLLGFLLAIVVFLIVRECTRLTNRITKKEKLAGATS